MENHSPKIGRQAVIIIHGIGEQRPMETLRNFVRGIYKTLKKKQEDNDLRDDSRLRSKPDSIGDIYETVKITLTQSGNRPTTDFYEFYWAHNMRNSHFAQMTSWFRRLIFTSYQKIPERLRRVWLSVWAIVFVTPVVALMVTSNTNLKGFYQALPPVLTLTLLPFLFHWIASISKSAFFNSAGDAARYFTPQPDNISERSAIRQQGLKFLKKLHTIENSYEKVDRIILVGHSLGSVIAYDLIRLLWIEYQRTYQPFEEVTQDLMKEINKYANGTIPLTENNLEDFQDLQFQCWEEQCRWGNRWLISDFITLGAAVNALDYFMVSNTGLEELIEQRELPVCPPIPDDLEHNIYHHGLTYETENKQVRSLKVYHHGAPFAVTRWTNIYYSSDFVGGPMRLKFGLGIKDVCIQRSSAWLFPGGHTSYWNIKDRQNAIKEIIEAMHL